MTTRFLLRVLAVLALGALWAVPVHATNFEDNTFQEVTLVSNLSRGTAMTFAPDGRLFILQQSGDVRIFENGGLVAQPFLSLDVDDRGERGLLGIVLDPAFATNNYVYLYYTPDEQPYRNRVSRFTANGNTADPNSELILVELDNLTGATNHNGGSMAFGADNRLYVAVGDSGSNAQWAQDTSNRFGTILRYNTNGSIPTDNPFYNTLEGANRAIWAYGLRNPFVIDIDPVSGRLFINDVGQSSYEEINEGVAGANYGWPLTEGPDDDNAPAGYVPPIHSYDRSNGQCAITGGTFYRPPGSGFPTSYNGDYFFADYCARWIRYYDVDTDTVQPFATNTESFVVDLITAPDGSLYYLARGNGGSLRRIFYDGNLPATIAQNPEPITAAAGENATFTCAAVGTGTVSYQWQRNNVDIPGATDPGYTLAGVTLGDSNAAFRCVASNGIGSPATSTAALLTVLPGSRPQPQIFITLPESTNPSLYEGGKPINFSGTYTDPDPADAALPDAAFDWQIDFHHDHHTHPFRPSIPDTRSGTVTVGDAGHTETNVWYRVYLTVTDSVGLTGTTAVDVFPLVTQATVDAIPSGIGILLDGSPRTTPFGFEGVSGVMRSLSAPETATQNNLGWTFHGWLDSPNAERTFFMPPTAVNFTAIYAADDDARYDVNNDDVISPSDVVYTLNRLGDSGGPADVDNDGTVTESDADLILVKLGQTLSLVPGDIPLGERHTITTAAGDGLSWHLRAECPFALRGERLTWTGTLTNNGNTPLTDLTVRLEVGGEVSRVRATADTGRASVQREADTFAWGLLRVGAHDGAPTSAALTWTLAELAPGETATLTLHATVPGTHTGDALTVTTDAHASDVLLLRATRDWPIGGVQHAIDMGAWAWEVGRLAAYIAAWWLIYRGFVRWTRRRRARPAG
jgi:glucose/arabinose dehydrogenase